MLIFDIIQRYFRSDVTILVPGSNSIRILLPFIILLKRINNKKIYVIAVGGWLANCVLKKKISKKKLLMVDKIFVQTQGLKNSLNEIGITNTSVLYNFRLDEDSESKEANIDDPNELVNDRIKLVFCSRVVKQKGIETAIEAVKRVIMKGYDVSFHFYGSATNGYLKQLSAIIGDFKNIIKYMGVIDSVKVVSTIKNYDLMIFPTYHHGEGFPGTILEAYKAGIPVIASDWKYNREFINEYSTGLLCRVGDSIELANKIIELVADPKKLSEYKEKSRLEANKYLPDTAMNELNKMLEANR